MNRVSSQMAAGVLFLLTTVSALGAPPSTRQLCGLHAVLHILDHYKIEYQAAQVEHAIFGRDEKVFSSLHDLRVAGGVPSPCQTKGSNLSTHLGGAFTVDEDGEGCFCDTST